MRRPVVSDVGRDARFSVETYLSERIPMLQRETLKLFGGRQQVRKAARRRPHPGTPNWRREILPEGLPTEEPYELVDKVAGGTDGA